MSLSCSCSEWEGEGWTYYPPDDFSLLKTKRRKRCCSCKALINIGSDCIIFDRVRMAKDNVEYSIFGDEEIKIAPWYMCETCGEIYLNLEALGFCVNLGDKMDDLLKEYHEISGFKGASN